MDTQNYGSHRQWVPIFHFFLLPLLLLTVVGSIVNLVKSLDDHERLYSAALIVVLSIAALLGMILARTFALKAQDRAIRAEENLRHFAMTGKLLDSRLTIRQIIALRFASDGEFIAVAKQAAESGSSPDDIKKMVKNWRPDTYRV
jgi:L-cystine uptake protein TcyP (sodium:dicarboxylate symporter family)